MDETGTYYTEWSNSERKTPIHYTNAYILNLERWLEQEMAAHSSTLAWKIPWTEEPGRLQSMGSQRVGHDWETSLSLFTFMHWRSKWHPFQGSCLGNPRDGGALWAAVYGVVQTQTRLKQLSCSSSKMVTMTLYTRQQKTQMQRTVFWTLWEKARVRWFEKIALKHKREKSRTCCSHDGFRCIYSSIQLFSCVWLFVTPWTVTYQVPPSVGFSKQEYWSGLPHWPWFNSFFFNWSNLI